MTEAYFVTRTVRALEVLAFRPVSAPELAQALQIHPRTARRMLRRLVEEEYATLATDHRRRYSATMRLVALAGQLIEHAELPRLAGSFVALLHERTGLTAHLALPSYDSVVCVVHVGPGEEMVRPQLRELVPAHCTATGKALLAWRDRWRASILRSTLRAYTPRTETDPAVIEREVLTTRERGWAGEDEEYELDVRGVAAPIFSNAGEAVAALGVTSSAGTEANSGDVVPVAAALSTVLRARAAKPGRQADSRS